MNAALDLAVQNKVSRLVDSDSPCVIHVHSCCHQTPLVLSQAVNVM